MNAPTPPPGGAAGGPPGGWHLAGDTTLVTVVLDLRIDGEPQSKARARRGADGHFYTPRSTVNAESVIAHHARRGLPRGWNADPDNRYGVRCVFATSDSTRRDGDNMLKLVQDALNKVVWRDDWQVTETAARVDLDAPVAASWVRVYRIGPLPPRPARRLARKVPRPDPAAQLGARAAARAGLQLPKSRVVVRRIMPTD